MPYNVHRDNRCPSARPWGVVNAQSNRLRGCHPSQDEATQQQRALYAAEQQQSVRVGDMDHKAGPLVQVKVVDESKGEVQCVFSTLNVIDKDRDVTLPGAFGEQKVRISAYNHQSWSDELPIGKGVIREVGNEAILDGQFFMDVQKAKDTFNTIKHLEDLMEWSYGYDVLERDHGTWPPGDAKGEDVQFLKKLKVHEVSPVILGAGENTRTLSAKSAKGPIAYSSTGTTDVNWDAGLMTRRVTASSAALRALCAWVDSSGDANSKSSYKFPHHMVSENGAVGAANTRACSAAIAVLNGGRGGSSIPDGDRQGVYNHVAHHIRDSGADAPPLKSWAEYQQARKEWLKQNLTDSQISDAKTVINQILALLNADEPPVVSAVDDLIDDLEEAIGVTETETEGLDFTGGVKLFDHLAWVYSEFDAACERVAKAVAQRAENGQKLADPTMDVVKMLLDSSERLSEAVAIQPQKNPTDQVMLEQIFRNSQALLFNATRRISSES